jgi:RimJ/RimL family protein N-acetyltransferase
MQSSGEWPAATRIAHADEMVPVLGDEALYEYTGGSPPTLEELQLRYARQVSGRSPDRTHGWLNWIVREREHRIAVGTVQATLAVEEQDIVAVIGWIIGVSHQRRGYATEAAEAMVAWLARREVIVLAAHIDARHTASIAVATRLGLAATRTVLEGETRWSRPRP